MPYVLGIDIGTTSTVAAVVRRRGVVWTRPEVVRLDARSAAVPSVLHLSANGSLEVGTAAWPDGGQDGSRIARGFCRRIGDDVPLLLGGEACTAQTLTAVLAMWVVERVTAQERESPEGIMLSHSATWGPHRVELLHRALYEIGLENVALLPEAVAVAESHAARGFTGRTAAVYSLGGNGFEACLVRRTRRGIFETFGVAQRLEPLGGADFDDALQEHVRAVLSREFGGSDDPRVRFALGDLAPECERAKRELSLAAQTDVVVRLPSGPARIPVTRGQFEEMIRPAVQASLASLVHTLHCAGLAPDQLDGVLLTGGSARIPLVVEMLAARFPGLMEIETDPQATAAVGAALAASQAVSPRRTPRREEPRHAGSRHLATEAAGDRTGGRPDRLAVQESGGHSGPPPRPPVRITPPGLPKSIWLRPGDGRKRLPRQRRQRVG